MNVVLYVAMVTLGGLAASYRAGRAWSGLAVGPAGLLFSIASLVLAAALAFLLPLALVTVCAGIGLKEAQCVHTDDQTVWFLAVPLVACPGYVIAMFLGRNAARSAANSPQAGA
jgi:hypothetical protein